MSDSEGETYEKQVKIVLVGDGSSGKVMPVGDVVFSRLFHPLDIDHRTIFKRFIQSRL